MMKNFPVILLAGLLAGCGVALPERESPASEGTTTVQTVAATTEEWPVIYEATGTVQARTSTTISSRLMANVREVRVQTGDRVQEGQVLVTLDARDLDTTTRRVEATRAEIRAAMPEADSAVASAKANLDLAQVTFNRMQELYEKKSITDQEHDEALAKLKAAQAAQDMARAHRTQLDSKMAQVEQEARAADVSRSYAEITAPFAGVITAKSAEPGMLAVPGAPLFTIERASGYRLEAGIEESRLAAIHIGQPVSVTLGGLDRPIESRVSEIEPTVIPATRTYIVKIDLPASASIRSGMFGRAAFPLDRRNVVAIPAQAVSERGQMQSVMVAADGFAHTRLISSGEKNKDQVEILSGIAAGEKVIAPVPPGLTDGARIEVR